MRRLPALSAALVLLAAAFSPTRLAGQVIIQGNINGGNQGQLVIGDFISFGEVAKREPDPTGPHLIEFFDGRTLHGTIEALDLAHQELSWRRSDTDVPLIIPTTEISRLSFDLSSALNSTGQTIDFGGLQPVTSPPAPQDNKAHATIKFSGGDWLVADVGDILDNKIHLQLTDGSPLVVDRSQVEWIYFAKGRAAECYDGPTSLSGWISGGGWSYRDGALRAINPTRIGQIERNFGALPDQVEYQFEVDQGNLMSSFTFSLHGRPNTGWNNNQRIIECAVRANTLSVQINIGGNSKNQQLNLPKALADALDGRIRAEKKNPAFFRIFEDFTGGRLLIFINGQRVGELNVEKGETGTNSGTFTFRPTVWNSNGEQTLSKIRMAPWDGRLPEDTAQNSDGATDRVSLADGTTHDGKFVDYAAGTVRMRVEGSGFEATKDQVRMLHFGHQGDPAETLPSVAHLRLLHGGEIDAASIGWHEGKFDVGTRLGMRIAVPVATIAELRFAQTAPALAVAQDILVFKNGDRLKGHLESASESQKVRWRAGESEKAAEFAPTHILGVRRDIQELSSRKRIDCATRFRNGDWLAGQFLTMDKENLVLETADAGQLTVPRAQLRTLYFSRDGTLPISDGATDEREWLRGLDLRNGTAAPSSRLSASNPANLWKSFDGTFSLNAPTDAQSLAVRSGGLHIGRQLDNLPALAEVSFDVTGFRNQILFTAQLFSEPSNPGYLMQFHGQGLYIYDLNPVQRGRGIVPQQTQFDGKLKPDVQQRHIQLLANRNTGQVTMLVDGVLITRFGGKPGSPPRPLGHGLMLSPQIGMPCSFSNLWFGPWNGRIPGQAGSADAALETVVLNNGDETQGSIELATPTSVKVASEVGPLDLPLDRLTMLDFGGPAPARSPGARVHLAGSGVLTIGAYRLEKDTLACHSAIVGDLLLPLGAIQELVLSSAPAPKPEDDKR